MNENEIETIYFELLNRYPSQIEILQQKNVTNIRSQIKKSTEYRNRLINIPRWNKYIESSKQYVNSIEPKFSNLNLNRCVLLIEPRCTHMIEYVIKNVYYHLEKGWSLVLCHGIKNEKFIKSLTQSYGDIYYINIRFDNILPVSKTKQNEVPLYDILLKSKNFWCKIPFETIFLIQTDIIVCKKGVEQFCSYNYIGAPWKNKKVGCGGFSIRKRSECIKVCSLYSHSSKIDEPEDVFFSKYIKNICPFNIAKSFCNESYIQKDIIGIHQPWLSNQNFEILESIRYS